MQKLLIMLLLSAVTSCVEAGNHAAWVVVHAELPCAANGVYQTKYNQDSLSRTGVANTAACQAICAASSACDFFSYSFSHNQKCATYYQGTCAVGDAAHVGFGYTTYAKPPPPVVTWVEAGEPAHYGATDAEIVKSSGFSYDSYEYHPFQGALALDLTLTLTPTSSPHPNPNLHNQQP